MTDTELRGFCKARFDGGLTIDQIVHPYSGVTNLSSLDITTTAYNALSAADRNTAQRSATLKYKDAVFKERVFTVFGVTNTTDLATAINDYTSVVSGDDILEKEKQVNILNFQLCQSLTDAQIVASYSRTSSVVGIPNLEDMITYNGLTFLSSNTDLELAQIILGTL